MSIDHRPTTFATLRRGNVETKNVASGNEPTGAVARRLLKADEVARRLGCSARTVYRLADGGKMPWGVKLGSLRRWDADEIECFIADGCPQCN
jgi:excisionase family DNA binding protein